MLAFLSPQLVRDQALTGGGFLGFGEIGAAGDPAHPHAFNQLPAWLAGTLHPCDHPRIEEETADDRHLEPIRRT